MRVLPVVTAAVAISLLSGCSGDEGVGSAPVTSDPPSTGIQPTRTEAEWKASPGQLDKVTTVLGSRRYACSDLDGDDFTWRVCTGDRRTVKLVAAEDGTIVRFVLDANGGKTLLAVIGPHLVGPSDTAILQADGTTLQWGTVGDLEIDGFARALSGTIAGLRQPPTPPAGPLAVTKEQVLVELTKTPLLKCRIDDGMSTPEPKELGRVDVGPTLDCHDRTVDAGAEIADDGSGVTDIELTASDRSKAALGSMITTRLQPVWAALGPDLDEVRQAVGRLLGSGLDTTGYAAGWKIAVDHGTERSDDDPTETTGHSVAVRILRERPDLADPRNRR